MKNTKKFISILIVLCMVLTMMPITALAITAPIKIGNVDYDTLAAALAAAQDGDTITLNDNITELVRYTVSADKTITIDGNGKKITGMDGTSSIALALDGTGVINLKDITLQGGATTSESTGLDVSGNVIVQSEGTVNANAGACTPGWSYGVRNNGTGTVNVTNASSSGNGYGVWNFTEGTVNVNTVSGGVNNFGSGTVNVTSVTAYGTSVYNNKGGTVNVTTAFSQRGDGIYINGSGIINIANNTGNQTILPGATGTIRTGAAITTLTLYKGVGAECILDSITVAAAGDTTIGTLPNVYKNGIAGLWYMDSAKTTLFSGTTVNGETNLYSSFYISTVTFNKNGGTTEADPITKTVVSGENIGTLPTPPAKDNCIFSGWNTAADGTGTAFTEVTPITADITLYAQWKQAYNVNVGTINNGSITPDKLTGAEGDTIQLTILPSLGYKLKTGTLKYSHNSTDYPIDETTKSFTMPNGEVSVTAEFEPTDSTYVFDSGTGTIVKYNGSETTVVIPSMINNVAVTRIGDSAFKDTAITSVDIPEGVIIIGNNAFKECKDLSTVKLPSTLTSIGDSAFIRTAITSMDIPEGVSSIGNNAFTYCTDLSSVKLPSTLTSIGSGAFYHTRITSIDIPEGVSRIESSTFQYCSNITSVKLPNNLQSIGRNAFYCTSLENIVIPENVTSIDQYAFSGEAVSNAKSKMLRAFFLGDAPTMGDNVFNLAPDGFKIYYPSGNATYTDTWCSNYTKEPYDPNATSYTLSYDGNENTNGGVPDAVNNLKPMDSVTVSGNTGNLEKTGYRFVSWNTKADGTGDNYVEGSKLFISNDSVTLYAIYKKIFSINIGTTTNGRIEADKTSGLENERITLSIIPDSGYSANITTLKFLDSNNNDAEITDVDVILTKKPSKKSRKPKPISDLNEIAFLMPATDIKVTMDFNKNNYIVTFNKNGGDTDANPTTKTTVNGGEVGNLPTAPTRAGYTFNGWNTAADGSGTGVTSSTVVSADITVYAQWKVKSSGNTSSGNSGGKSKAADTTETTNTTITKGNSVTVTAAVKASVDKSGSATATISGAQINEAIKKATDEANKMGNGIKAIVEIKVKSTSSPTSISATIPQASISSIARSDADALTITTEVASVTFDQASIDTISKKAIENVKIKVTKVDAVTLSVDAKQMVGDRPVYNFSVTSGDKTISKFDGAVTVSVPYSPKPGEDTNAIVIYYINAQGELELVSDCVYDSTSGMIIFKTTHFSLYAVGYNKVDFYDVTATGWYSDAVRFLAARGITTGTGNGNYSPEAKLTRGQFLVMVMEAYGISADENSKDNFSDAGNTYYTGYLAAAKKHGITAGIGNNMFDPEKEISRQEMFTLLYNTLKKIGELPTSITEKSLTSYSDASEIASWSKDAMTLFVKTGIISGSGDKLNPTDITTRAEMAQMLYKLMAK